MKPPFLICLAFCQVAVLAQGTIGFQTYIDGSHAAPPNGSANRAEANFALDSDNHFQGSFGAETPFGYQINAVRIYETSNPSVLGQPRLTLDYALEVIGNPPFPGYVAYQIHGAFLSEADRTALLAGRWYVNVSTFQYPEGEIRGQIVAVPEPSTLALVVLGAAAIVACRRRDRR